MKAQLALRMKYRLAAVRKRHYVPHSSGARARAKFQFVVESKQYSLIAGAINLHPTLQIRVQDILGPGKFAELWQCHDPMFPQVLRGKMRWQYSDYRVATYVFL